MPGNVATRPQLKVMAATPADAVNPTQFLEASDARFQVTDFAGSLLRQTNVLRVTRSIVTAGDGYHFCAPGARARFRVMMPPGRAGRLELNVRYTGIVVRLDQYKPDAPVLINGTLRGVTTLGGWTPDGAHPVANVSKFFSLAPGVNDVEVLYPYCASFDFQSIRVPHDATIQSAPVRPNAAIVYVGDSITHGFSTDNPVEHWPFLLSEALGCRTLNLGYGGRVATSTDLTAAAATDATAAIWTIGTNNYLGQLSVSAFGATIAAGINLWFAGGNRRKLWVQAPPWISGALSIPIADYRAAMQAAVVASPHYAAGLVTYIDSTGAGFPTGAGDFPDGVHPDAAACIAWATALAGIVTL